MEYQKFKEKIDVVKYTSVVAEYKRNIRISRSIWINALPNEILEILKNKSLDNKFLNEKLFVGLEIAKDKTFISEATLNTSFEIVSQQPNGWAFTSYAVKAQKNGGTKLKVSLGFKLLDRTRVGLNGELGSIIWKWKSRKQILELFKYLKKQFPALKNN